MNALFNSVGEAIDPMTSRLGIEAILDDNGLDWTVEQKPIYCEYEQIKDHYANYRSDNHQFLGLTGSKYTILDNIEAFKFLDELDDFIYDRAGTYKHGRQVFIVGKTSNKIEIQPNDYVEEYLTFLHGHDGKNGIRLFISPIRTKCCNQLNILVKKSTFSYSISHRGDLEVKLSRAKEAILQGNQYLLEVQNSLQQLTAINLKVPIYTLVEQLIPIDPDWKDNNIRLYNKRMIQRNEIIDIYIHKDDNQNYKGTKFGFLNAVADYISHQSPGKTTGNEELKTNFFLNTIQDNKLLNRAYDLILAA